MVGAITRPRPAALAKVRWEGGAKLFFRRLFVVFLGLIDQAVVDGIQSQFEPVRDA